MWKDAIVAYFKGLLQHLPGGAEDINGPRNILSPGPDFNLRKANTTPETSVDLLFDFCWFPPPVAVNHFRITCSLEPHSKTVEHKTQKHKILFLILASLALPPTVITLPQLHPQISLSSR
jgi:hypothetical protein